MDEQKDLNSEEYPGDSEPESDQPDSIEREPWEVNAEEDTADSISETDEIESDDVDEEEADLLADLPFMEDLQPLPDLDLLPPLDLTLSNSLDIDAALASVASLSDVIAEREAAEVAEAARIQAEARAAEESQKRREAFYFEQPPAPVIVRGQMASVVPALVLMAVGAWMTFTMTTSETPLQVGVVLLVLMAGIGVSLVGYWLSTQRWSQGAAFIGFSLLLAVAGIFYLSQSSTNAEYWSLLLAVPGAALILSTLLSKGTEKRLTIYAGFMLVIAGLSGLVATTGMLNADMTDTISTVGPIVLGVAAVLVAVPTVIRRRR